MKSRRQITVLGAAAVMLLFSMRLASAADWYTGPATTARSYSPQPAWTGFYAGLNVGYSWSASNTSSVASYRVYDFLADSAAPPLYTITARDQSADLSAATASGRAKVEMNGVIAGGQIGFNYDAGGGYVVGVEADIQGSGAQGNGGFANGAEWNSLRDAPFALGAQSNALPLQLLPGAGVVSVNRAAATATAVSKSIDSLGTVRARVGYLALPTLLLYATGGVAYGSVRAMTTQSQTINNSISTAYCLNDPTCPANPGSLILSNAGVPQASLGGVGRVSGMRVGWTLGAGMEWLFMPRWSLKAEYLYFDLGSKTYASSPLVSTGASLSWMPNSTTINESVTRVRFNGSVVRVGLNFHFN
ncbi:MAG: hypothetical protein CTY15_02800 [Methylocystis sp.]|nr:MAG: hypothetical protein CTY15_02800 [Methylocystis sp.]